MQSDEQPPHLHQQPIDPHPRGAGRFVGRAVAFDDPVGGAAVRRLVGVVEAARYIGLTERGQLPDYALSIRGASGALIEAVSLVNSYASFPESP